MTNMIVIRGLPGSGKSTAAKKFVATGYTFLEADMFYVDLDGVYNFDYDKRSDAWAWTKETYANLLRSGQDVVLAGVFPYNRTLQKIKDECDYMGVSITVLTVEADHGNIHEVPEEVLAGMKAAWEPLNLTDKYKGRRL